MPNETSGTERREVAGPTLRGMVLWVAAGAALFLGMGAALPLWSVAPPPGGVPSANGEPSPLWQAVSDRVRYVHAHHRMGLAMRYLNPSDDLVLLPLYLMAVGAALGFSAYCIWSCSGRRKG